MKAWLLVIAACSSPKTLDAPGVTGEVPPGQPGQPSAAAHGLAYYGLETNFNTSISTPALATQATGSTLIVSVGRGKASAFALPTDSKGNTYQQLGSVEKYTRYPDSGTAVYAVPGATGGAGLIVTTSNAKQDEITLAAVEVANATHVQDQQWTEQLAAPLQSKSVTTTGPATLVAFWWGDAPEPMVKTATPNNGFTVVDSVLDSGALVQCAVAVKNVAQAGTYDVTWTATPAQGAQLWLIAVQ
jgi:hypothetical protein